MEKMFVEEIACYELAYVASCDSIPHLCLQILEEGDEVPSPLALS